MHERHPAHAATALGGSEIPNDTLSNHLRHALRYTSGNTGLDALVRQSLHASIPETASHLHDVYQTEVAPEQVQLDLHLSGDSVKNHSTNANVLGDFISHLSDAVKETAKAIGDKRAWSNNILVSGVQPGSVHVVLQVPDQKRPANSGTPAMVDESSLDSRAVRAIALTMSAASDDDAESEDEMVIAQIPKQARRALRLAAKDVKRAGWDIEGSIAQRGKGIDSIRLTHRGADRLVTSLAGVEEVTEPKQVFGEVDGVKNSLGQVFIVAEPGGSLTLSSTDDKKLAEAARLAAEPGTRVKVSFEETRLLDAGGVALPAVSRTLTRLERSPHEASYEDVPLR